MVQKTELTIPCVNCNNIQLITVKQEDLEKYKAGHGHVQNIFPYLLPSEREMLLSGICGDCWDQMFNDDILAS